MEPDYEREGVTLYCGDVLDGQGLFRLPAQAEQITAWSEGKEQT